MDFTSFFEEPDKTVFYLHHDYNRLWRCKNCETYILSEQQLEVHYVFNCSKKIKKKPGNI